MSAFLYPVPSQPPADGSQHTCTFGDDWLAIILDRVDDLRSGEWFESAPADIKQQVGELIDLLMTPVIISPQLFPHEAIYWHNYPLIVAGNALQIFHDAANDFGWRGLQSTPAINDHWRSKIFLAEGDYDILVCHARGTNHGIVTIDIGGEDAPITLDMYGTSALNLYTSFRMFITGDGEHQIDGNVLSKNAGSTNYYCSITAIFFREHTP